MSIESICNVFKNKIEVISKFYYLKTYGVQPGAAIKHELSY
jgi:hypothetical protein